MASCQIEVHGSYPNHGLLVAYGVSRYIRPHRFSAISGHSVPFIIPCAALPDRLLPLSSPATIPGCEVQKDVPNQWHKWHKMAHFRLSLVPFHPPWRRPGTRHFCRWAAAWLPGRKPIAHWELWRAFRPPPGTSWLRGRRCRIALFTVAQTWQVYHRHARIRPRPTSDPFRWPWRRCRAPFRNPQVRVFAATWP